MTEPLFPCTNALQTPNPSFWTTKTAVPKFPQNGGSTPTPCLDKDAHAQGGGGVRCIHPSPCTASPCRVLAVPLSWANNSPARGWVGGWELKNRKALSRGQNINFLQNLGFPPWGGGGGGCTTKLYHFKTAAVHGPQPCPQDPGIECAGTQVQRGRDH